MRWLLPSLFFALVVVSGVSAQEAPDMQLEFIRRLRAKGYHDLALEQIERLKADTNLAGQLELERARTMLAIARDKTPEQRPPLFEAARTALVNFIQRNSAGTEGAQARLEMARLIAFQGQALLNQALKEDDNGAAKKAREQFIKAGQEFDTAINVLAVLAGSSKDADPEKERATRQHLAEDVVQARLDRARNLLDQAITYLDTFNEAENRKRAEAVDMARKSFNQLADSGGPVGFMAATWLIKVNLEAQNPTEAEKYRKKVMSETSPGAAPAQRLARLFYMQGIMTNPLFNKLDPQKKFKLIEDEGTKWLSAYPGQHKSPEGLAVRYELAHALFMQAQALSKTPNAPPTPAALVLLNQAQKHFIDIAASDSNLAEKARGFNVQISVLKMGENATLTDLKDFDKSYLKAQMEMFKLKKLNAEIAKAGPLEQEKLAAQRKKNLHEVVKALTRAIALAEAKTPAADLAEARFLLVVTYLLSGDPYRAAVAGDALGRSQPPSKRSGQAAGYAIEAYVNILQGEHDDSSRQHLKSLMEFVLSSEMQKSWAAEQVTDVARYQLAMLYNKDGDVKRAIAQLEKLSPDYRGYVFAQAQLVLLAQAAREKAEAEKDKKAFAHAARTALARIPNLPGDADANTGGLYFRAQLEWPQFLYNDAGLALEKKDLAGAEKLYHQMSKFVADLKHKLEKSPVKLSSDTRASTEFATQVWAKWANLGLADVDYRKGNYDKVLATTDKTVADVAKAKGDGKSPIRIRDYQVTGNLLGLALRANVQKGNIAKAEQILGCLDRLTGEEGGVIEANNVLGSLIGDLQAQIKELKRTNDSDRLKSTVKNFSSFIDKLAAKNEKGFDTKTIKFLATCYSSLEEYSKAAGLYAKIPEPKALAKDKLSPDDEKDITTYWYLRIQYAKALRLSAKSKTDLGQAKKVLDDLQKHKYARLQIYGDVEQFHILEDSAKFGNPLYGTAMKGWAGIMNNSALKARMADEPNLKELYFTAYYQNVWCLYQLSQTEKVVAAGKEKSYLTTAANHIVRLEKTPGQEGWQIVGHRFRELLNSELKLRDEYEILKRNAK
jgi:hypothetical protein